MTLLFVPDDERSERFYYNRHFLVFCIAPGQAIMPIIAAVSDFTRQNTY